MSGTELSVKLREDARRLGLCDQWYNEWKDETSIQELIDKYKRGLDFCIERNWPSKAFIRHHFPQNILRTNGILLDDSYSYPIRDNESRRIINISDFVLLGDSHATIRYSFRSFVSNAWVRDTSEIKAIIKYGAYLMVHLFDNAKADVFTDLSSRVVIIKHSRNASVRMEGNVVVKEEYDYMD